MIRIEQIKLRPFLEREDLLNKICQLLRVESQEIDNFLIVKKSLDARKKPDLWEVYTVDVTLKNRSDENRILKRVKDKKNINIVSPKSYHFPNPTKSREGQRPIVVGLGPAGLFCALYLARAGYRPIVLERGKDVDERTEIVQDFWANGKLDTECNVQFGEGGAGTFSDGKLNTLVKDKDGRNTEVLRCLVEHGAPDCILYDSKPHIGTDVLVDVVKNIRNEIISHGGEVHFNTRVECLLMEEGVITGVNAIHNGESLDYASDVVVLAIGHSARDTFSSLYAQDVPMEAKSFAVGYRVMHKQQLIDHSQYGAYENEDYCSGEMLPPAAYKLTAQASNGHGVYSFCMCPGGYVVNASSCREMLAVNGMSYHARESSIANSAIIMTVTPQEIAAYQGEKEDALIGVRFQECLEKKAYALADGKVPVQTYGQFKKNVEDQSVDAFLHNVCIKGSYDKANVRSILPEELNQAFMEGMESFDRKIKGFASDDTLVCGVESRTSSPIKIMRDDKGESAIAGLYPCGEGAGYAGGITSAAMDGLRVAEKIALREK